MLAFFGYGALLFAACASFGHLLLTRLFRAGDLPALETAVTSVALGLVSFVIGMYAAGAFIGLVAAVTATFKAHEIWARVEWADGSTPVSLPRASEIAP